MRTFVKNPDAAVLDEFRRRALNQAVRELLQSMGLA